MAHKFLLNLLNNTAVLCEVPIEGA